MENNAVNKDAQRIHEITGRPMAECEEQAKQIAECVREMCDRVVEFYYLKKDGTTRQAFGTLQQEVVIAHVTADSMREPKPDLVTYFDTEAQAWRSFKKVNFKNYVKQEPQA
jgi:hypothetical protein